jgi:hypothetical protein
VQHSGLFRVGIPDQHQNQIIVGQRHIPVLSGLYGTPILPGRCRDRRRGLDLIGWGVSPVSASGGSGSAAAVSFTERGEEQGENEGGVNDDEDGGGSWVIPPLWVALEVASVPLPGTFDIARCKRRTAGAGKCPVCRLEKAAWIDRQTNVNLCEHCYNRET